MVTHRDAIAPTLEAMIDLHGVATVLATLAHVCSEKADHIKVNWQDGGLALTWDRTASDIGILAERIGRRKF